MSVLVTGGAGYIGSHMVLALADAGEDVIIIDDLSTGFEWLLDRRATLYHGDIEDTALLSSIFGEHEIDAVVHFAGSIVVPESVSDPLKYYWNNTSKSRTLIECCVRHNIGKFIFSSTAATYGMPESNPISEQSGNNPISPYGTSKLMTEWMLRDTAFAHDFRYVALRYFNVAGADPKGRSGQSSANATHLIKVANQVALGDRPHMEIFGTDFDTKDGTGVRDYIHVADLIGAHMKALGYLKEGGDSLIANCGYGHGYSVKEVIASVERVSGVSLDVKLGPPRDGDPAELVADSSLARKTLGWTYQYDDLDKIVSDALDWERHLKRRNA
ncbi:MAG: UDP-glucose 4-epimerase [Parvibaculaceae bacterium]|jgi:UDP-glucose 4-epimerase